MSLSLRFASRRDEPFLHRFGANRRPVDAAAVILNADDHVRPRVTAERRIAAAARLALHDALRRRFDAVVQAVAQAVYQRLAELVQNALVQFGLGALRDQVRFFAQFRRKVVHQAAEIGRTKCRSAACGFRARRRAIPQPAVRAPAPGSPVPALPLRLPPGQARLVHHQFAHQVDQPVQPFRWHPHGRLPGKRPRGRAGRPHAGTVAGPAVFAASAAWIGSLSRPAPARFAPSKSRVGCRPPRK